MRCSSILPFFFFNDTATTEIYTLSLHDALPISGRGARGGSDRRGARRPARTRGASAARSAGSPAAGRSEEHTSELQSRPYLVCRLLLGKKKNRNSRRLNSSHTKISNSDFSLTKI